MKHFGDITKIKGNEVPIVDVITGGSPCQDLSIAGKRAGLKHSELGDEETTRSGLFMEQMRIIKEMHNECRRTNKPIRPRYFVFENVTGLFSSNNGEDFRTVLEETARIVDDNASIPRLAEGCAWSNSGCVLADRWSIAWRVHDAQFWGVAQRRRRIALVADFRGQTAPEILFERESLSRNSEPIGTQGQDTAADTRTSSEAISFQERAGCDGGVKAFLSNKNESVQSQPLITSQCLTVALEGNDQRPSHKGDGYCESDVSYTLNTTEVHGVAFSQDAYDKYTEADASATIKQSGGVYGGGQRVISDTVNALCADDYKGINNQYINDKKVIINYGRNTDV